MNAVSTRMDGMLGAFSTAKPACSTLPLWRKFTPPSSPSTARASLRLSLIWAVRRRSARVISRYRSFRLRLTPPIRSALFSFIASRWAAGLVAPCSDKANTDEQRTHVGLDINQALKPARDRQGDVLFAGSTPSPGTRILSAVPWIDHDRDETIDGRFLCRLRLLVVRLGLSIRLLGRFSVRGFPEGLPHFQLGFLQ